MILVGKVIGHHGLNGTLKVYSFTESSISYKLFTDLLVDIPKSNKLVTMKLIWFNLYKKGVRLKLEGIDSRDTADSIINSCLYVKKSVFPPLLEDTYFWSDLINISVKSVSGRMIGKIDSIICTGSNDVYVVKRKETSGHVEVLIPAIKSVVLNVDLGNGIMLVALPYGLE